MKVNRKELLNELGELAPGLSESEIIEQSNCFMFSEGKVYTYNDSFLAQRECNLDVKGAVIAKPLLKLLDKTDEEELDISVGDNQVLIKGKAFKAGIPIQDAISFPLEAIIPEEPQYTELPELFGVGLDMVRYAAGKDMTYPALTCIHADKNIVEACDGFQAITYLLGEDLYFEEEFFLPAKHVNAIMLIEPDQYYLGESFIHFQNTKTRSQLSCRLFDVEYPSIAGFFDVKGEKIRFPKQASDIVERASVFSQEEFNKDSLVHVRIKENLMLIEGQNEQGWYKEKCRLRYKGTPVQFNINPKMLSSILELNTNLIVGERAIKIEGENFEYIVTIIKKD